MSRNATKTNRGSSPTRHFSSLQFGAHLCGDDTLDAVENLAILLDEKGRPKEAAKLRTESVENIAILKVFDSPAPPAIGHSAPSSKRSGPASERKSRVLDLLQTPSAEEVHGPTIRLVLDKLAAAGIEASEEAAAVFRRREALQLLPDVPSAVLREVPQCASPEKWIFIINDTSLFSALVLGRIRTDLGNQFVFRYKFMFPHFSRSTIFENIFNPK